ncbi:hypothetical protein O9H85_08185 [Paenibacillus filicis]|uniref:Uncharacterized protein n=1 Tax=Paenibacillus gyeongsangnamensis TaxID=3388067 RepID=A0ABT4Q6A9_9BACL|nr:hypothetical protein [Paenibacillus filicis]MCZ8512411.1 hypothetical protein [Paenibacillus filicis]
MKVSSIKAQVQIQQKTDHPNKVPFNGTLFYVDRPSENPPSGTSGRKLYISREVAENSLSSLEGMCVNASYWLDEHEVTNKIGVIETAWIEGDQVKVSGYLFGKDFPDQVNEIKERQGDIGMSLETTDTILEDYDYNGENVANATSIIFTGAAILYKWAAAYTTTAILAANKEAIKMDFEKLMEAINNVKADVTASVEKAKEDIKNDIMKDVNASIEALNKKADEVQAGKEKEETAPQRRSMDSTQLLAQGDNKAKETAELFAGIDKQELSAVDSMAAKLSAAFGQNN